MKWLISLSILVAFSVGIICTESEDDYCTENITNQYLLEHTCMRRSLYNATEFTEEFNLTILQYTGNDGAVDAFTNKYCPILRQTLECLKIGYDVDVVCLPPLSKETNLQNFDFFKAVLNYVCINNTEVVLRFLKNSGLDTIYPNKRFDECFRQLSDINHKVDSETLGPTTELCDGVDRGFACYADYTREHANQDLAVIGSELRVVSRLAYKC